MAKSKHSRVAARTNSRDMLFTSRDVLPLSLDHCNYIDDADFTLARTMSSAMSNYCKYTTQVALLGQLTDGRAASELATCLLNIIVCSLFVVSEAWRNAVMKCNSVAADAYSCSVRQCTWYVLILYNM